MSLSVTTKPLTYAFFIVGIFSRFNRAPSYASLLPPFSSTSLVSRRILLLPKGVSCWGWEPYGYMFRPPNGNYTCDTFFCVCVLGGWTGRATAVVTHVSAVFLRCPTLHGVCKLHSGAIILRACTVGVVWMFLCCVCRVCLSLQRGEERSFFASLCSSRVFLFRFFIVFFLSKRAYRLWL